MDGSVCVVSSSSLVEVDGYLRDTGSSIFSVEHDRSQLIEQTSVGLSRVISVVQTDSYSAETSVNIIGVELVELQSTIRR